MSVKKSYPEIKSSILLIGISPSSCILSSKLNDTQLGYIIENFPSPFTDSRYIVNSDNSITIHTNEIIEMYSDHLPPFKINKIVNGFKYKCAGKAKTISFEGIPDEIGKGVGIYFNELNSGNLKIDFTELSKKKFNKLTLLVSEEANNVYENFSTNVLANLKIGLSNINHFVLFNHSYDNSNNYALIRNLSKLNYFELFTSIKYKNINENSIDDVIDFYESLFKLIPETVTESFHLSLYVNMYTTRKISTTYSLLNEFIKCTLFSTTNEFTVSIDIVDEKNLEKFYKQINLLKILFDQASWLDIEQAFLILPINSILSLKKLKILSDEQLYPFRGKMNSITFNI